MVGVAPPNPHQQEIDLVSRFFELEQQLQGVSTASEQVRDRLPVSEQLQCRPTSLWSRSGAAEVAKGHPVHLLSPKPSCSQSSDAAPCCCQGAEAADLLQRRLGALFEGMPRDLQATMLSAPHRANLLQV